MGEEIVVKAKIQFMEGFSAHADKNQMLEWFRAMEKRPKAFFVVHGDHDAAFNFAEELQRNLGTATAIPQYGDSVVIEGTDWHMETSHLIPEELPEGQELHEALRKFERDIALYKTRIEQITARDSSKATEIRKKIEKAKKYVDEILKNV
jgi:metallo-beta-lactamase family protein